MEPESLSKWFPVFRDFAIVTTALGALVYEVAFTAPNALIIGLIGSILLGPSWVRFSNRRKAGDSSDDD